MNRFPKAFRLVHRSFGGEWSKWFTVEVVMTGDVTHRITVMWHKSYTDTGGAWKMRPEVTTYSYRTDGLAPDEIAAYNAAYEQRQAEFRQESGG